MRENGVYKIQDMVLTTWSSVYQGKGEVWNRTTELFVRDKILPINGSIMEEFRSVFRNSIIIVSFILYLFQLRNLQLPQVISFL